MLQFMALQSESWLNIERNINTSIKNMIQKCFPLVYLQFLMNLRTEKRQNE